MTLQEYNKLIFKELKDKYGYNVVGFFNGNKIFIVGQNPGNPMTEEQKEETNWLMSLEDFDEVERHTSETYKSTLFGNYVDKVIGGRWDIVSFSNIVKVPTAANSEPTKELIDEQFPMLLKQIEYVQPRLILLFGKFAGKMFGINNFYGAGIYKGSHTLLLPHPSWVMRQGKAKEKEEIEAAQKVLTYIEV
jgi:uracil-DNA glycosylase